MLVEMSIGTATMENSVEIPQKIKNITTIWFNHITAGYIVKGNETSISKQYLHLHVHYSIIYNSQDKEAMATKMRSLPTMEY